MRVDVSPHGAEGRPTVGGVGNDQDKKGPGTKKAGLWELVGGHEDGSAGVGAGRAAAVAEVRAGQDGRRAARWGWGSRRGWGGREDGRTARGPESYGLAGGTGGGGGSRSGCGASASGRGFHDRKLVPATGVNQIHEVPVLGRGQGCGYSVGLC